MNADHIKAVEQVFPEVAVTDQFFQILVGGGDDAHVHMDRRGATHPVELILLQHAQQTGLGLQRHIADFIEKQGAAVGLLETPDPLAVGAGESALLVAEQFRFDQVLGDRRHIQRHEVLLAAHGVAVQGPGHQLLAGARLAVDQHRHVGVAEPADGAEHLLHGRRLADDLGGRFRRRRHELLVVLLAVLDGPLDQRHRLVHVERLGQVFERAALVGRHRRVQVGMGGHDDHRQIGVLALQDLEHAQAVGARHAHIGNQHVGLGAALVEAVEGLVGVFKTYRLVAFLAERLFQHPANGAVVVDHPNGCGHDPLLSVVSTGSMGSSRLKQVRPGSLSHSIRPWCWLMIDWAMDSPSPEPLARPLTMG